MIIRVALCQINCTVGDLEGNSRKIEEAAHQAAEAGADIIAFPELAITGYPPEDLLLKPGFIKDNKYYLQRVVNFSKELPSLLIVGFVDGSAELYNSAAAIGSGKLWGSHRKVRLPNYGVFDEKRYFSPGKMEDSLVLRLGGMNVGVSICEDIWSPDGPATAEACCGGAQLVVNINASPFHVGKWEQRLEMLSERCKSAGAFVAYCNLVGGQDELVFDGGSMIVAPDGELLGAASRFREDTLLVDLDLSRSDAARSHNPGWPSMVAKCGYDLGDVRPLAVDFSVRRDKKPLAAESAAAPSGDIDEIYDALLLGTGDYICKNGFHKVVVGLSGGIDSALVATVAADIVGPDKVECVFMPSKYTSEESRRDATQLAKNLGSGFRVIPIDPIFDIFLTQLAESFAGTAPDVAEENIQARIRGNLLMALSNKFGWLLLSTGNKSEMSVGYATLYGDMSGGFAVLKDVPKTLVYRLAEYRNARPGGPVIPESILTKAPTAELRPNQKDTDALPPYEVLDPIIECYVVKDLGIEEISNVTSTDVSTVEKVVRMIDASEYKRRQSPPGVKITPRAFGRDWRVPITNRYLRP